MSNDVSKTLDKALSLATKLQNTHEELNSWLEKVESEMSTFEAQEAVGEQLTSLQDRQKVSLSKSHLVFKKKTNNKIRCNISDVSSTQHQASLIYQILITNLLCFVTFRLC